MSVRQTGFFNCKYILFILASLHFNSGPIAVDGDSQRTGDVIITGLRFRRLKCCWRSRTQHWRKLCLFGQISRITSASVRGSEIMESYNIAKSPLTTRSIARQDSNSIPLALWTEKFKTGIYFIARWTCQFNPSIIFTANTI